MSGGQRREPEGSNGLERPDSERAAIIRQHEARGSDLAITSAIDAHIETAKPARASLATARRKHSTSR
jgi:hypothetical protein